MIAQIFPERSGKGSMNGENDKNKDISDSRNNDEPLVVIKDKDDRTTGLMCCFAGPTVRS